MPKTKKIAPTDHAVQSRSHDVFTTQDFVCWATMWMLTMLWQPNLFFYSTDLSTKGFWRDPSGPKLNEEIKSKKQADQLSELPWCCLVQVKEKAIDRLPLNSDLSIPAPNKYMSSKWHGRCEHASPEIRNIQVPFLTVRSHHRVREAFPGTNAPEFVSDHGSK